MLSVTNSQLFTNRGQIRIYQDLLQNNEACPSYPVGQAILNYIAKGEIGGHFFWALMAADLQGVYKYADEGHKKMIPELVEWLNQHMPAELWGSKEKIDAWKSEFRKADKSDVVKVQVEWHEWVVYTTEIELKDSVLQRMLNGGHHFAASRREGFFKEIMNQKVESVEVADGVEYSEPFEIRYTKDGERKHVEL